MANYAAASAIVTKPTKGLTVREDQPAKLQRFHEWLFDAEKSTPEVNWATESAEDYKFYAGDQDTVQVKLELAVQERPCSVYNEVKPKIDMLCGLAAQTKKVPQLFPTGTEDEPMAELMNHAFKHYRYKTKLTDIENECFEHMAKSGRSFLYFYINTENPFKAEIKAKRIPGRDVRVDPNSIEYDLSDARFVFIHKWYDEDNLKAMYPQIDAAKVRSFDGSNSGVFFERPTYFDEMKKLYRLTEVWYRDWIKLWWFQNPVTGVIESLPQKEFGQFKAACAKGLQVPGGKKLKPIQLKGIDRMANRVHYAIYSGDEFLEGGLSPYTKLPNHFPIVLFGAYKNEDENRWFSAVTMMKDPQRGLNTMRRQLQHLLQTSPKGILVHEVGAIIDEEKYDTDSSKPNFRLVVKQGAVRQKQYEFTQQPQISPVYGQLMDADSQGMKNTSGAQDSLLGIQTTSREPGITVRMRMETGMAVLFLLFDNFRKSKLRGGEILVGLMQQYVTEPELVRIEGPVGQQLLQINSQANPQASGFNDITVGEYDLVLDEALENTTMRMAVAQMLVDYNQSQPGAIPPDIILEFTDLPFSVKQRIKDWQLAMMAREDTMKNRDLDIKQDKVNAAREKAKQPVAKPKSKTNK